MTDHEHVCRFRLTTLTTAICVGDDKNCYRVLVNTEIAAKLNEHAQLEAKIETRDIEIDVMNKHAGKVMRAAEKAQDSYRSCINKTANEGYDVTKDWELYRDIAEALVDAQDGG